MCLKKSLQFAKLRSLNKLIKLKQLPNAFNGESSIEVESFCVQEQSSLAQEEAIAHLC